MAWSARFEELHGLARGAFGDSLQAYSKHIHPDDVRRVTDALHACVTGGEDYRIEYRLIDAEGVLHHLEASGRRIRGVDGRFRLVGVCRDVSERARLLESERAARREAETSDLHYRALAAMIPQQVWTATPEGALDFVNDQILGYFGRAFDEMIGAGWRDVIHPGDRDGVVERRVRSLSTGEPYEVEFRLAGFIGTRSGYGGPIE